MCDIVVKKFTSAISSPDEFLLIIIIIIINCIGNGVARNIKDACEKLQLDHSINSILNDIPFNCYLR